MDLNGRIVKLSRGTIATGPWETSGAYIEKSGFYFWSHEPGPGSLSPWVLNGPFRTKGAAQKRREEIVG